MLKLRLKSNFFISFLIIFFALTILPTTAANAARVEGVVVDQTSAEPLMGANVIIEGTSLGAATDLYGKYYINVPPGMYTLIVKYIGYEEVSVMINVGPTDNTIQQNFELNFVTLEGEVVEITAQAEGQIAAINQQLTSRAITNVVSSEKMQELPDANAAEALGRLPGISLQRNSGEANKIVVRGLSPKYNNVTIEGVKMASTNDQDRSVDLSLVQGEMLGGVEVSKSLRPDMDADALGGTINLTLKEADSGINTNFRAEGGYADMNGSWDNYKFVGSVGTRFFSNKLGAQLELSGEKKQLPRHQFSGGYSGAIYVLNPDSIEEAYGKKWNVRTQDAGLTIQDTERKRYGVNLVLDYKSEFWDVKFSNMYNQKKDDVVGRLNTFNFVLRGNPERWSGQFSDDTWTADTRTHTMNNLFKFSGTELRLNLSTTHAERVREGERFDFVEVGDPELDENWLLYRLPGTVLEDYPAYYQNAYLQDFNLIDQDLTDDSYDIKLDYEVPFTFTKNLSGKLQLGGKYHNLKRESDGLNRYSSFEWGGSVSRRQVALDLFPWIETDVTAQRGLNAHNFVDQDYDASDFLDGRYEYGWTADIELLKEMQSVYYTGMDDGKYFKDGLATYQADYETTEELTAFYLMTELNIGENLMILPGVRYEKVNTEYTAWHVSTNSGLDGVEPNAPQVTTKRDNEKWFPSVNFKYKVHESAFIQGAYYKSTSRPDFRQISPMVVYSTTSNDIRSNNPWLEPSDATNYDLGFSIFSNTLGLFSMYGYYKEIDDLVYYMRDYFPNKYGLIVDGPEDLEERLIGPDYYNDAYIKSGKILSLPLNNPETAYFRGIEASWQTNFWYLPGLLSGLVLDINYTFINSRTRYPYFESVTVGWDSSSFIPKPISGHEYNTRQGKMEDQPKSIFNVILGWDYKGFSTRLSYRRQDKTLESIDSKLNVFDHYYDKFTLIDLMLRQQITQHYSVYANLTNLGNHIDDYYIASQNNYYGETPRLPTRSEHYGFRAQFGINITY